MYPHPHAGLFRIPGRERILVNTSANGSQQESSASKPTITITPPPTSSQISPERRKWAQNLYHGPPVGYKGSRKFRNASVRATRKAGIIPNRSIMAPTMIAVIDGLHMVRCLILPVDTTNGSATVAGEMPAQLPRHSKVLPTKEDGSRVGRR
jgi:hypothetical protein